MISFIFCFVKIRCTFHKVSIIIGTEVKLSLCFILLWTIMIFISFVSYIQVCRVAARVQNRKAGNVANALYFVYFI